MVAPIEVTTKYVATVDDLAAAWVFVMDRVDRVGPDPSVQIKPLWIVSVHDMGNDDTPPTPRQFEVVVEGMVTEAADV
jgi:hypothetical protein